jgi:hypothetical protein
MPAASARRDDDRDGIPILIDHQGAPARPLQNSGGDAVGAKCGGGSAGQRDRYTPTTNRDHAIGAIEQRFKLILAHSALLATLAQMSNCSALCVISVSHRWLHRAFGWRDNCGLARQVLRREPRACGLFYGVLAGVSKPFLRCSLRYERAHCTRRLKGVGFDNRGSALSQLALKALGDLVYPVPSSKRYTQRAIDFRGAEKINEAAFEEVIRAAVAANSAARAQWATKKK